MAKKYTVKRGQPKPNDGKENKNSSIWIREILQQLISFLS